ncbi:MULTISPECIES: NADPH-dependent F420 reductase [Anaerolinea]|uniref:F420-dependent NADPH reductase n=1 Tax=Anaerolinea thermophila (strain DSM 14523 / JCM 11388 / NBRC 100420 / UNI-1) TaxID=926569 RepID=E8N4V4_ANATU|nr:MULTISPECIES: NADPH-dependent F420 reductase [Anaerolinea]BAJ63468.1 F420-dependent NADPH reductase [Anaerolinea thermophila UNI-1]
MESPEQTIAIIGGTGKEGKGLAYRWAKAGYTVLIGSRVREKALATVAELRERLGEAVRMEGMTNQEAAEKADIVVLTVPYAAHQETLLTIKDQVQGKILIDVTVPLMPPKVTRVHIPPAGSAAQEAQNILGPDVQVVSAFQNISYEHLLNDHEIECDVLVCGGTRAARAEVIKLVEAAGLTGWDAGPIENSIVAEGLTSILIGINKQYGVESAGIRITGVQRKKE